MILLAEDADLTRVIDECMNDLPPDFIGLIAEARLRSRPWRRVFLDLTDADLDRLAALAIAATL